MSTYAAWIAEKALNADAMELHCVLLPCGERMAASYRALLGDPQQAHLGGLIRQRLADLETTLANLRGAKAA